MWPNQVSNPGPLALESDAGWGVLSWAEVDWRCRCTKIFAKIFLNLEIYYIVSKKLVDFFFHVMSSQTTLYIAQMQHMYDFLQTLFHTAILGGEETVMKISTKCNRCNLFQTMSELSARLAYCHAYRFCTS